MARGDALTALARRLALRDAAWRRFRAGLALAGIVAGVGFIVLALQRLWFPDFPVSWAGGLLALILAGGLGWTWVRTRADPKALLLRADREFGGAEQLVTTYELQTQRPDHPFLPALKARCESLAGQVVVSRLVPLSLGRRELAAGLFALAALALLLIPPAWVTTTRAEESQANPAIAEEGYRLERWSERLDEVAERESFQNVRRLATEMRKMGDRFQSQALSPEDAARQVDDLAKLAQSLAAAMDGKGADGTPGEPARKGDGAVGGLPGEEEFSDSENEEPQISETGKDNLVDARKDEDALAEKTVTEKRQRLSEDPNRPVDPDEMVRTLENQTDFERQILENSQRQLEQTSYNITENFISPETNLAPNAGRNAMENPFNNVNPDTSAPGSNRAVVDDDATGTGGSDAAELSNQRDTPAEDVKRKENSTPEETAYQDTRIEGTEADSVADELWVRRLPILNARTVQAEDTIPEFERSIVSAQGGTAIPRAYRSVVKSYFIELERLTQAEN